MNALLSMQNGEFTYGEKTVFRNLNLEVYPNEVLCILGANGCGKTTLLHCLSGNTRLKNGKIQLNNQDIDLLKIDQIARKIGFVFQEHTAPFPFSVLEVVRMGRAPHLSLFAIPSRRDTEIAGEKLNLVGLFHLKDKPYTQISGGERQLVLIARTLAQEPDLILMDEPTSHLDFRNQTIVLQIINRLAENGLAILMTSHLPDHALYFSNRVALMKSGSFLSIGKPADILTEDSLREVYGIDVRMFAVVDPTSNELTKIIMPVRERASSAKTNN